MSRYKCNLSPELLEKAVTELNEPRDNNERLKAIDQLRESYKEEKYGPLKSKDDKFILKFLRAKKFDQKKALVVLQNYHKTRRDFHEIFDKVNNPVLMKEIFDTGVLCAVNNAGKDGSCILINRNGLIKPEMDLYDLTAYGVLTLEKLLEDERNQICGMQSIDDLKGFNISIMTKISMTALARMNSIWQDAMPMRVKALHMLNEGKFIDVIMAICRVFVKEKFMKRIQAHGKDYKKLQEMIKADKIPSTFEGDGPPIEEMIKEWNDYLSEDWPQDTYL